MGPGHRARDDDDGRTEWAGRGPTDDEPGCRRSRPDGVERDWRLDVFAGRTLAVTREGRRQTAFGRRLDDGDDLAGRGSSEGHACTEERVVREILRPGPVEIREQSVPIDRSPDDGQDPPTGLLPEESLVEPCG